MATRRTRKRPLERRFEEGPFLSLGMPYAHGGLRNARTVILLFVASYAGRRSPLYLGLLYFIFGQNGKHLAHRRRPSILHRSFSPLSPSNRKEASPAGFSPPFHVGSFSTFSSHFLSDSLFPPRIPSALPSTRCPNCLTHSAPRDGAAIYRTYRSFYCTPFCIYLDSPSFLASMVQRTDENSCLVDEEFLSLASFCVTREIRRFVNSSVCVDIHLSIHIWDILSGMLTIS